MSANRYVIYELLCDLCEETPYGGFPGVTLADVRKDAALEGWRRKGKHDYCPACIRAAAAVGDQ